MLTAKQNRFVESFLAQGDKVYAACDAGYSAKSAHAISCQLLKKPYVIAKINELKVKIAKNELKVTKDFSRDDFIQYALEDYKSLELTEANRPRMLELAGKGAGIIGSSESSRTTNTMNVQINLTGAESTNELWELTRKLIGNS